MNHRINENLDVEINSKFISVESKDPLRVLSSAVLNPGLCKARSIVNYRVGKEFDNTTPEKYTYRELERLELPKPTVAMLTAANTEYAGVYVAQEPGFGIKTVVTAGISFPITTGVTNIKDGGFGTINTIVLSDGDFSERAMVDAVRTATEAKVNALKELDLRDREGSKVATGTATDAIAIACTGDGEKAKFGGPATKPGNLIARSVRKATKKALKNCGFEGTRSLRKRLEERGITFDRILETAEKAYVKHPDHRTDDEVTEKLEKELEEVLKDINVATLILAGVRIEEDGRNNLIPNLTKEEFDKDPVSLLSDEILGMRIANYINGSKGVFEFYRLDRKKPGILSELGPFLDDVIGGLIGGVCSKAYERRD